MSMLSKKGLSMVVTGIITVLITIAMIVAVIFLFLSKYLDIHEIVLESVVDRHALVLGHALLAYEKLAYNDGNFVHRGIFEKGKIVEQFQDDSDLTEEIGYPNSIMIIGVKDLDSGWDLAFKYRGPEVESKANDYLNCLMEKNPDIDLSVIFKPFLFFWDYIEVVECVWEDVSNHGTVTRIFPVGIKDGDRVSTGALYVTIYEGWATEEVVERPSVGFEQ